MQLFCFITYRDQVQYITFAKVWQYQNQAKQSTTTQVQNQLQFIKLSKFCNLTLLQFETITTKLSIETLLQVKTNHDP